MRSRPAAALLGFAALFLLTAAPRVEADHHDEEAPAGAPEVADELITFHADGDVFSVQLPRNWKSEKIDRNKGQLGFWTGPGSKRSNAGFEAQVVRVAKRAELAHHLISVKAPGFVEDSVETGEGWIQSKNVAASQRRVFWRRYVDMDGVIVMVQVIAAHVAAEELDELAKSMLSTFEPKTAPDMTVEKSDWTEKKVKGLRLVTDVEKDRLGEAVEGIEDVVDPTRDIIRKALPGKPYIEDDPPVRVYTLPVRFRGEAELLGLGTPEDSFVDPRDYAQVVTVTSFGLTNSQFGIAFRTADAYLRQYFGGDTPHWLSAGLSRYAAYGFRDGGKPDKPDKTRMKQMRGRITGATASFDSHFAKGPNDYTGPEEVDVLWAWHWFFRHAKNSKKYRKPYESYIETLRETGDPAKADACWDDVDFGKMLEAFRKWGDSL